ncbi:MAG: anion transporter [Acidobacteria bacterium]|nr:anion transporter [Acidobacteriota bacterium]
MIATTVIFAVTFLVLAIGRLPGYRIDRTGAAIIGASLMVATGGIRMEDAWKAINSDTILLLFGMMIVVANLRLSGFFRLVTRWILKLTHSPLALLTAVVWTSGVLSAFFVNDTVCLILTPVVLDATIALGRNPVPYLIGVATGSNIGSACTITGNPQNMIIGTLSMIPYRRFSMELAPVSLIGLCIAVAVIAVVYRDEFRGGRRLEVEPRNAPVHGTLLAKSVAAAMAMIACFFAGVPVAEAAMVTGAILLITRRVKPEKVYHQIDFSLLVMFCGLFVVTAAMERTPIDDSLFAFGERARLDRIPVLAGLAVLLSNLVSNVPAVLMFKPVIPHLADPEKAWLVLAMASTFAGNTTVLASVANLIVVEKARAEVEIRFTEYLRAGLPITALTLAAGCLWLSR